MYEENHKKYEKACKKRSKLITKDNRNHQTYPDFKKTFKQKSYKLFY